jgi:uncharacterized membrane protein
MSGGITLAGLLGSVGGAAAVGVSWWLAGSTRRAVSLALVAGICGSVLDSVLGASVQALFQCARCGALDELGRCAACGQATQHVRGVLNNDAVNAAATAAAASLGAWIGLDR